MQLTRRDVIAALTATGIAVGSGVVLLSSDQHNTDQPLTNPELATLTAAAEVLYPTQLTAIDEFVAQYVHGRAQAHRDHVAGVAAATNYLDEYTGAWYDVSFAEMDESVREDVLHRMNADTAAPDPDGSDIERVRYYVINDLLFALYSTPAGGELVGIENPQGYPGGIESYQHGPPS